MISMMSISIHTILFVIYMLIMKTICCGSSHIINDVQLNNITINNNSSDNQHSYLKVSNIANISSVYSQIPPQLNNKLNNNLFYVNQQNKSSILFKALKYELIPFINTIQTQENRGIPPLGTNYQNHTVQTSDIFGTNTNKYKQDTELSNKLTHSKLFIPINSSYKEKNSFQNNDHELLSSIDNLQHNNTKQQTKFPDNKLYFEIFQELLSSINNQSVNLQHNNITIKTINEQTHNNFGNICQINLMNIIKKLFNSKEYLNHIKLKKLNILNVIKTYLSSDKNSLYNVTTYINNTNTNNNNNNNNIGDINLINLLKEFRNFLLNISTSSFSSKVECENKLNDVTFDLETIIDQSEDLLSRQISVSTPILSYLSSLLGFGNSGSGLIIAAIVLGWPIVLGLFYVLLVVLHPDKYSDNYFERNMAYTMEYMERMSLYMEDKMFDVLEDMSSPGKLKNHHHHHYQNFNNNQGGYNHYARIDEDPHTIVYNEQDSIRNNDYSVHGQQENIKYDDPSGLYQDSEFYHRFPYSENFNLNSDLVRINDNDKRGESYPGFVYNTPKTELKKLENSLQTWPSLVDFDGGIVSPNFYQPELPSKALEESNKYPYIQQSNNTYVIHSKPNDIINIIVGSKYNSGSAGTPQRIKDSSIIKSSTMHTQPSTQRPQLNINVHHIYDNYQNIPGFDYRYKADINPRLNSKTEESSTHGNFDIQMESGLPKSPEIVFPSLMQSEVKISTYKPSLFLRRSPVFSNLEALSNIYDLDHT